MKIKQYNILKKLIALSVVAVFAISGLNSQIPVSNFSGTPISGCAPLLVTFQDISTGNPTSWNWDFGNGQLSTSQNPVISFSQPGTYTVRLIVRNAAGGIDDEIKTRISKISALA